MSMKNAWVNRSAFDSLMDENDSLREEVREKANHVHELSERGLSDRSELRRANDKYRSYAVGLGILATVELLVIWGLSLRYIA